ncbi:hypothetical protein GH714_013063 [Hevea brasiliensis]|uniref:Uncharacterized protein n=1 Tax=Hevea brasiliensis TaxID=3981 RepID=A0A6A6NCM5_HEVBR|nr:hypothetical protein GH714_013063 [Hevea brasiliensis]
MKLALQSQLSLAKVFFAIHSPALVSSHMVEKCPTIFTIPTEQDNNFSGTQLELKRFGHVKELNCRYDFLAAAK